MPASKSQRWFLPMLFMLLPVMTQAGSADIETVSVYRFNPDKPVVPEQALVVRAGIPGVFVAYKGQARFRMVRVGKSQKNLTSILSGLHNNDAIIRESQALFDGQQIKVQP